MSDEQEFSDLVLNGNGDKEPEYQTKKDPSYKNLRLDLSEEELQSPGIPRLLLKQVYELKEEISIRNRNLRDYNKIKVRVNVLGERIKSLKSINRMSALMLIVGGALLAHSARLYEPNDNLDGILLTIFGTLLIVGSWAIPFITNKFND